MTTQSTPAPEILIVFNPLAGTARRDQLRHLINLHFVDRSIEWLEVAEGSDTKASIKPYLERGVHLVIVAGGDGTISSAAAAMANSNVPMGILPIGTGNVLARELAIPINLNKAAKLLATDFSVRRLDAIRVADRLYLLAVGVGLSALTMRRTRTKDKQRFGRLAYLSAFLLSLVGLPQHDFELVVDGEPLTVRANELMAVNAGAIGYKTLRWGPNVRPDDGSLDLCFIRVRTVWHFIQVFFGILSRQEFRSGRLKCITVRESIQIQSPDELLVQGDGDLIGQTPITLTLLPSALKIAVPRK